MLNAIMLNVVAPIFFHLTWWKKMFFNFETRFAKKISRFALQIYKTSWKSQPEKIANVVGLPSAGQVIVSLFIRCWDICPNDINSVYVSHMGSYGMHYLSVLVWLNPTDVGAYF